MKATFIVVAVLLISSTVFLGCMTGLGSIHAKSYTAKYSMSLWKVERPEKASQRYGVQKVDTIVGNAKYQFSFEDQLVRILWLANSRDISFSVENKTDHSIKIPWDEAAYVDENGRSHRVMHAGVKYSERESPQPPSIIVRRGSLEDLVFPTDLVYYREGSYSRYYSNPGGWEEKPLLPDLDYHSDYSSGDYTSFASFQSAVKAKIGKTYQVLLPLQIEDVINDYIFTFKVDNVSAEVDSTLQ